MPTPPIYYARFEDKMASGKTITYIFGVFIFLVFISAAWAEESNSKDPASVKEPQPVLWLQETTHDIGRIQKGVEFGWGFLLENRWTTDLALLKALSSVPGKIKVNMPPAIKPGEAEYIYIAQDSSQFRARMFLM
jgi:hypothetical protein